MAADRRELSDAEKAQVRARFENCYICGETLNDYEPTEIQYDHIYAFADGYSQDLSNFAPVHASREPNKRNCHKQKGRKSPFEYKEELRIRGEMQNVSGLRDICPAAASSEVTIDEVRCSIRFNGRVLPLYNQRLDNKDHLYFFDEIETRYIENDDKIQPRPLEEKIYAMIIHLRSHVQLLPSLGRLDLGERKVKIFDGQHKAVAQIKGNRRDRIPCIVFVNEDVEQLRKTVFAAHTDFLQQRYKKSHIDNKLAEIFAEQIRQFREALGNPQAPYTEMVILRHESAARRRAYLLGWTIDGLRDANDFVDFYVAQDRKGQKQKPMIWDSLELFVKTFCNLTPVEVPSDDAQNFRECEVENLQFLLDCVHKHAIQGKWNPALPDSEGHKLSRKFFYDKALTNWLRRVAEAMKHAFDQMAGRAHTGPLCYRPRFSAEVRQRFDHTFELLVTHGLWLNPANDPVISGNSEKQIDAMFTEQRLDWVYLTGLE